MQLERNERYWGPKPAYDQVSVQVIAHNAAREAALLAGDIDLMENVPPDDVARLRASHSIHVFAQAGAIPDGVLRTVIPAVAAAIKCAAEGFAVNPLLTHSITIHRNAYAHWPSNAAIYLPGGRIPQPGLHPVFGLIYFFMPQLLMPSML